MNKKRDKEIEELYLKNLKFCLKKIPKSMEFKFKKTYKTEKNIIIIELISYENISWFIKLKKNFYDQRVLNKNSIFRGVLIHEIGHYFFRDQNPKDQEEKDSLDIKVDNLIKEKIGFGKEISDMRKREDLLCLTLKPESCKIINKDWKEGNL